MAIYIFSSPRFHLGSTDLSGSNENMVYKPQFLLGTPQAGLHPSSKLEAWSSTNITYTFKQHRQYHVRIQGMISELYKHFSYFANLGCLGRSPFFHSSYSASSLWVRLPPPRTLNHPSSLADYFTSTSPTLLLTNSSSMFPKSPTARPSTSSCTPKKSTNLRRRRWPQRKRNSLQEARSPRITLWRSTRRKPKCSQAWPRKWHPRSRLQKRRSRSWGSPMVKITANPLSKLPPQTTMVKMKLHQHLRTTLLRTLPPPIMQTKYLHVLRYVTNW